MNVCMDLLPSKLVSVERGSALGSLVAEILLMYVFWFSFCLKLYYLRFLCYRINIIY